MEAEPTAAIIKQADGGYFSHKVMRQWPCTMKIIIAALAKKKARVSSLTLKIYFFKVFL